MKKIKDKLLKSQNNFTHAIHNVLTVSLLSKDLSNIVLNYCEFLLLEWIELLQSKLDDAIFSTYPFHMQVMIKNFIEILQGLDQNPDQPLTLKDTSDCSQEFKKPSSAFTFLLACGLSYYRDGDGEDSDPQMAYYKLRDMIIGLDLEQKSKDLFKRTSLLSGAKEYALEKSDLSFLFKLGADFFNYRQDEYTLSKVTTLLDVLNNNGYDTTLSCSQEQGNKYSLIILPGSLSNILEDLPAHKQAYIDFQQYGALSPGLITSNMIDELSILPKLISQLVCSFLYLDLNKTIFSLAGDINTLYVRHYEQPAIFCPWYYLLTALRQISERKTLKICPVNHDIMNYEIVNSETIYYPNPLQAILDLNEGRHTIQEMSERKAKKFFLMEFVKELVKNASPNKVADIRVLESYMIQLVDFCHAATNNPKIGSLKVLQAAIRCTLFQQEIPRIRQAQIEMSISQSKMQGSSP